MSKIERIYISVRIRQNEIVRNLAEKVDKCLLVNNILIGCVRHASTQTVQNLDFKRAVGYDSQLIKPSHRILSHII